MAGVGLKLSPAMFEILLALAGGEKHGYAIMQEVEKRTAGEVRLGPGTLYRSIQRLLAAGLIAMSEDHPLTLEDDERRRYYRLLEPGRQAAAARARSLARSVEAARLRKLIDDPRSA